MKTHIYHDENFFRLGIDWDWRHKFFQLHLGVISLGLIFEHTHKDDKMPSWREFWQGKDEEEN